MKINLLPRAFNDGNPNDLWATTIDVAGEKITVSGMILDLSIIPDGATLPNAREATGCPYIVGDISRTDGEIELTIVLMHKAGASEAARFPQPIINPPDGPVELPR